MTRMKWIIVILLVIVNWDIVNSAGSVPMENWKFHFPQGSAMGIFLALALPLSNGRDTYFAYNFEANYKLPDSVVDYEYPPVISRQGKMFDRRFIYDAIESKMKMYGLPGKNCMLRTICEAADETLRHNGVLGDILHIVFTPSTSNDNNITSEYELAEIRGREHKCREYNKVCSFSVLNIVSWIGEAL